MRTRHSTCGGVPRAALQRADLDRRLPRTCGHEIRVLRRVFGTLPGNPGVVALDGRAHVQGSHVGRISGQRGRHAPGRAFAVRACT